MIEWMTTICPFKSSKLYWQLLNIVFCAKQWKKSVGLGTKLISYLTESWTKPKTHIQKQTFQKVKKLFYCLQFQKTLLFTNGKHSTFLRGVVVQLLIILNG